MNTPMTLRDLWEAINALPTEMDTLAVVVLGAEFMFSLASVQIANGEPTLTLDDEYEEG